MSHRGVALDDGRNAGVLSFLMPIDFSDEAVVRERLKRTLLRAAPDKVEAAVARIMRAPNPAKPPSQSLDEIAHADAGSLGTHPDLFERLWELDAGLPAPSRWVVYGNPALVHPVSGVVFGFAGGTVGYALRLPPAERALADSLGARSAASLPFDPPWDVWDVARAGPEWRLGMWRHEEGDWCRAAYAFAGWAAEHG